MPRLKLFGHRTPVAGDDLHLLCILYTSLRLLQVGLAIALVVVTHRERQKLESETIELECLADDGTIVEIDDLTSSFAKQLVPIAWIYVLGTLILACVYIITDATVFRLSSLGTPTNVEPRSGLGPFCSTRLLILGTIRLAIFVTGTIVASMIEDYCDCRVEHFPSSATNRFLAAGKESTLEELRGCSSQIKTYRLFAVLLVSQLVEVLLPLVAAAYICLAEGRRTASKIQTKAGYTKESRWKVCCACCCNLTNLFTCCLCGREVNTGGYRDVAKALSTYFGDGREALDLAFTDYLAALVVLLRVQLERKIECRKTLLEATKEEEYGDGELLRKAASNDGMVTVTADEESGGKSKRPIKECIIYRLARTGSQLHYAAALRRVLTPDNDSDVDAINEAAHFCRLALGIYGFMMKIIEKPIAGCCSLGCAWCKSPSMACCKSAGDGDVVTGDTLMGCNEIALLKQAGIDRNQLKYATFKQGFEKSPYAITVDDAWKSVVITSRGTLSLDDAVADLAIRPVLLDILAERYDCENARGEFCHNGCMQIADYIYQDLMSDQGILKNLLVGENAECSGYTLRIVGHSLGAGVAAVLATFLRPRYPSLRCLAFSPPGCVFSRRLANECKDYVTSYVLGDDVVPRLGLASMENLRHELLVCLSKIKVSKLKALRPKERGETVAVQNSRILFNTNADFQESDFWDKVTQFEDLQTAKKAESGPDVVLFPPGKIIHLYRTAEDRRGLLSLLLRGKSDEFVAKMAEIDDLQEIIVSGTALADHQPYNVCNELERFAHSFGLEAPYAPRKVLKVMTESSGH